MAAEDRAVTGLLSLAGGHGREYFEQLLFEVPGDEMLAGRPQPLDSRTRNRPDVE